jgi:hypothetical protein
MSTRNRLIAQAARTFFGGGRTPQARKDALTVLNLPTTKESPFTGVFGQYIKDQSVKKGLMSADDTLSKKSGLKVGETLRDYQNKEYITKQREKRLQNIAEGKGLNLAPFNVTRANEAAYSPSLVAEGLEGPMKAAIAKINPQLRDDTGIVKGALSQYRSDLGYYDLTKQQMEDLLSPKNVKKYIDTSKQYKNQLNKVVNQINEYRPNNQLTPELVKLMTRYANLMGSDPKYHMKRAFTFGHPSGIAANLDHYLRTGDQTAKMLSRHPKFLTKMQPELGPLNVAKETIDRGILAALRNTENKVTKKGLAEMRKLFDRSGLQSILPGQIYQKMYLGTNNPELQMEFLKKALNVGSKPFGKITQKDIQNIMFGKKTIDDLGFFRGGIASLLE